MTNRLVDELKLKMMIVTTMKTMKWKKMMMVLTLTTIMKRMMRRLCDDKLEGE